MEPKITLYNKSFGRVGEIGDPESLTCTPRHMLTGTAQIILPADHMKAGLLAADDTRVVIEYPDETMLSGVVDEVAAQGPNVDGKITYTVASDFRLLYRILAWPNPTAPITNQGGDGAFYKATGPAETVIKNLIRANCQRLGLPVTVAPDQGRGATITIEARFQPPADVMLSAVETAGLGITVVQSGAGFRVDVYQPRVWGQTLTEASDAVTDWSWRKKRATATRAVVGGKGVLEQRVFHPVVDTALEAATGDVAEIFVDGGDTTDTAALIAAGQQALAEHAPKAGLNVTLTQTETFKYGGPDGYRVGDLIPFEVGPAITVTDVLREVTLTWDKDGGLDITQQIGTPDNGPVAELARILANVNKGIRRLAGR